MGINKAIIPKVYLILKREEYAAHMLLCSVKVNPR